MPNLKSLIYLKINNKLCYNILKKLTFYNTTKLVNFML